MFARSIVSEMIQARRRRFKEFLFFERLPPQPGMATGASEASLHACGLDAAESGALGQLARWSEVSSAALSLRSYKCERRRLEEIL